MKIRIVLRTSQAVNPHVVRPFGLNQKTLVLNCMESLFRSCELVKNNVNISIVDDSSPEDIRKEFLKLISKYNINAELIKISAKSNSGSYLACLDVLKKCKENLFLLVEDDYLFAPESIPEILDAYKDKIPGTKYFAIHPTDYPERYEKLYPSYIFLGRKRHWRTIKHSPGTFVIPKYCFKKYFSILYKFAKELNESSSLNKIWEEIPLISPIPSLAAHLNDDTIPPFIDWEKYLNAKREKVKAPKRKLTKDNIKKIIKKFVIVIYKKILKKPFIRKI